MAGSEELDAFPMIRHTLSLAEPEGGAAGARLKVQGAIAVLRTRHSDIDRFLRGMDVLSSILFCDHKQMGVEQFLECLFVICKHAHFTRTWRDELKRVPAPPAAVQ